VLTRTPSAHQWKVLRRLRAIGCPVDWDHLAVPLRPLRVFMDRILPMGTDVFSVPGGTGIAAGVRVVASMEVTIAGYTLEADWLSKRGSLLEPCSEHKGKYCFEECSLSPNPVEVRAGLVVNHRKSTRERPLDGTLPRGYDINGLLLATFPEVTPPTAAELLPATLWIEDQFGNAYPFRLLLRNKKIDPRPKTSQ
jgi:hypothetical protein